MPPAVPSHRDHGANWKQEIKYYEAKNLDIGAYIQIIDRSSRYPKYFPESEFPQPDRSSGGLNESGFAITNTTVYETNIIHEEISNNNHVFITDVLASCKTIEDFDNALATYRDNSHYSWNILSGNFVVIDAKGGAALYEVFSGNGPEAYIDPVMVRKFDANNPDDAPNGCLTRTNSHYWLQRTVDTRREVRSREILNELYEEGLEYPDDDTKGLIYKNTISKLTKDVCGND